MIKKVVADAERVAKRMFWLAYQASRVKGLGRLQSRPDATEEDVWHNIATNGDYPLQPSPIGRGVYNADYVFGRMMKLRLRADEQGVELPDGTPNPEDQGWSFRFPTYEALFLEAVNSLGLEASERLETVKKLSSSHA